MHKDTPTSLKQIIWILLLAATFILALFLWQSHLGFSLLDEGYLWYGAQRVVAGEVPIRDFMSYDIGRYYWSAAFMSLQENNGIVALRVATAAFQAIALVIGLVLLARLQAKQSQLYLILATVTLVVWGSPPYRLFDISLPIMLIGALSFLIEHPSSRRYFLSGLVVGLVAVFGRNHGIYGVAGSLSIMCYLTVKCERGPSLIPAFTSWAMGVIVGYLPVLVFLAVVPGFALSFWKGILFQFEIKTTNFPLPVPWPWSVSFSDLPLMEAMRGALEGLFFIAIVAFGLLGIAWVIRKKILNTPASPTLIAAVFMALPYAHYAYSRADIDHLSPGIPPFLIGIFALLAIQPAKIKWPIAALLCGASLMLMLPTHPGWYCYPEQCVEINVAADKLKVDPDTAEELSGLYKLAGQFAPGDQTFIAAPFWPGAYAALGRKSPMWEIYALFPQSASFQQAEIERIKSANPGFAVIIDAPLDGRDELRFSNTHPLIDLYIRDNFEPLYDFSQDPALQIYSRRQDNQ